MSFSNLLDRIKRILGEPRNAWMTIAAEPATVQSLYTGWIMILAAIGPLALLASTGSLQLAIAQYVRSLIMTFVLALVVDTVAPSFGGTKDFVASLKLVAYSYAAAWLAGIFYLLGTLGASIVLAAFVYSFYTLFLGAPLLSKAAPDKAVPFTIVVVLCGIVLYFLARFAFTGVASPLPLHAGMGLS
ncbi:MAG TPA: YIP1 family protein [Casimicrobiaceae bacterium]|nr:YIP1 family protein [Casimicrobiaceae bacterium]